MLSRVASDTKVVLGLIKGTLFFAWLRLLEAAEAWIVLNSIRAATHGAGCSWKLDRLHLDLLRSAAVLCLEDSVCVSSPQPLHLLFPHLYSEL